MSPPLLFFRQARVVLRPRFRVLRHLRGWWTGDSQLAPVIAPYRRGVQLCGALLALDSLVALGVPFVGQAFLDLSSRGASAGHGAVRMAYLTGLLFGIEGLDPLRDYLKFRIKRVTSRYIADVRSFLLDPRGGNALEANLVYLHAPAFATRNIELPLQLPPTLAQTVLSGWLLWRMSPGIAQVAVFATLALSWWSAAYSRRLAAANRALRQAESEAMAAFESLRGLPADEAAARARRHFDAVSDLEIRHAGQTSWFNAVVERVGTVTLMKIPMIWGGWYEFHTHRFSTAALLTMLALAWNVQSKINALLGLVKARLEAESASFLIVSRELPRAA